jgi:hypothetical protein
MSESAQPPAPLPSPSDAAALWRHIEATFEEVIAHQQIKVLRLARRIHPGVTEEDLRNVYDFPDIHADPIFNFEDGILSGLIAARMTLKRRIFQPLADGQAPEPALTPEEVLRNMLASGGKI